MSAPSFHGPAELASDDPIDLWLRPLNMLKDVFIEGRSCYSRVKPEERSDARAAFLAQFGLGSQVPIAEMCKKITEFSIPIIAAFILDATPDRREAILDKMVNALAEVLGKISIGHDQDFFVLELHRALTLSFASRTEKAPENQPEELAFLLAQFSGYVREVGHVG